jgi:hypothetical protein
MLTDLSRSAMMQQRTEISTLVSYHDISEHWLIPGIVSQALFSAIILFTKFVTTYKYKE